MSFMWEHAPPAFLKFSALMLPANHRAIVPVEAYFAAELTGAMAEDCGPCTQLVVNMAREAGVASVLLQAILRRDAAAMSPEVLLAWQFADAIVQHSEGEESAREAVRQRWGEAGLVELSLALAVSRVFPMTKAGLGFARECRLVLVEDKPIAVVHAPRAI